MKGVRITLVVEPDESLWGFLDAIADGKTCGESALVAVRNLASEDCGSLFDDAKWRVEILTEEGA